MLEKHPFVAHHEINTIGQDYVVGDLHGCKRMFDRLLAHVCFDPTRDRIFSVGDLVDRGPDSIACLALLKEPWFFPVVGNHDAMLIASIEKETGNARQELYGNAFVSNKGWEWAIGFTPEQVKEYLPLLQAMPLVRVVGKGTPGRFQVVHAERVDEKSGTALTDDILDAGNANDLDYVHYIVGFDGDGDWRDQLLWGRSLRHGISSEDYPQIPEGVSRTFVGHTISVREHGVILDHKNHVFLDTGAYQSEKYGANERGFGLTLWNTHGDFGLLMSSDGQVTKMQRKVMEPQPVLPPIRYRDSPSTF